MAETHEVKNWKMHMKLLSQTIHFSTFKVESRVVFCFFSVLVNCNKKIENVTNSHLWMFFEYVLTFWKVFEKNVSWKKWKNSFEYLKLLHWNMLILANQRLLEYWGTRCVWITQKLWEANKPNSSSPGSTYINTMVGLFCSACETS